ncbi:MAG: D-glycero-D-manno-heptose 1,7-bisphosphate phosphatase [Planctomycetota bacterium]|jgi:D-glycero-D-manno-heptose 1,7-bisphosphate phosphatase
MMLRKAVFLDRDGTINVEVDYLSDPAQLKLIPGAAEAIRELNRSKFEVIVVTNQSGIARGMLDIVKLDQIHERLREMLAEEEAHFDAVYFCPHHPTVGQAPFVTDCECRKPLPGMLKQAAAERNLALDASSWIVGDSIRDLEAGAALGVPGILVSTGKGADQHHRLGEIHEPAPLYAQDLHAAVAEILKRG